MPLYALSDTPIWNVPQFIDLFTDAYIEKPEKKLEGEQAWPVTGALTVYQKILQRIIEQYTHELLNQFDPMEIAKIKKVKLNKYKSI
jgi:hypothetical protein